MLIRLRAWYLFEFGEAHLKYSKILSLDALLSTNNRNVP